jgi:hypothetical protein
MPDKLNHFTRKGLCRKKTKHGPQSILSGEAAGIFISAGGHVLEFF